MEGRVTSSCGNWSAKRPDFLVEQGPSFCTPRLWSGQDEYISVVHVRWNAESVVTATVNYLKVKFYMKQREESPEDFLH